MRRPSLRKILVACAALAAALATGLFFAPQTIGGPAAYLVIDGRSMEPGLSSGDLVVVRAAHRYNARDVVAYRSGVAGRTFVHRIVRAEGERFVLQGDANPYPDSGQPAAEEIYGKLWFSVPKAGAVLGWLGVPLHAALVGGALVLLLSGSSGAAVRRRRSRRVTFTVVASPPASARQGGPEPSPFAGEWTAPVLTTSGVAALAFAALGLLAFSSPTTADLTTKVPYRESGAFSYTAEAPSRVVYPDGRVDTGEPVFARLVDNLNVRFEYRLASAAEVDVSGRLALSAELSDAAGWRRGFELAPSSQFEGGFAAATGTVDLSALERLVARVERATGVSHESYTLALAPTVQVDGRIGGVGMTGRFAPRLQFRLDGSTLELDQTPGQAGVDRLTPARGAEVERRTPRAGTIGAFGVGVPVRIARVAALAGGALALVVLLVVGLLRLRALRGGEPARIAARYSHLLIAVQGPGPAELGPLVDVATIAGLARLAEPAGRPILHAHHLGAHAYYVEDGGFVYRYSIGQTRGADVEEAADAARLRLLGPRT